MYYNNLDNFIKYQPSKFSRYNKYVIQNINHWCQTNNKPYKLLSTEYVNNSNKLNWQCLNQSCGEIFQSSWNNIYAGWGCSFCAGKQVGLSNCLATVNPELDKEWHPTKNGTLTPYDITSNTHTKVWWQCLIY